MNSKLNKNIILILFFWLNSFLAFTQDSIYSGEIIEVKIHNYSYGIIQWQISKDKLIWDDIIGANTIDLRHKVIETAFFRAKIAGCPDMYYSDTILIEVDKRILINPSETKYKFKERIWQGIPSIERTPNGRLFATWYSGGIGEGVDNYVLLVYSDDNGKTWTEPVLVIDPPGTIRTFDPNIWLGPDKTLWFFWSQADGYNDGKAGVWCINTKNYEKDTPNWTKPVRLSDGIMMNKPIATADSRIIYPIGIWPSNYKHPQTGSNMYVSENMGISIDYVSHIYVSGSGIIENMIIEKNNGDFLMLTRTGQGIKEVTSKDGGRTWQDLKEFSKRSAESRFHIRRLKSGNILLLYHDSPLNDLSRSFLTAAISEDDGKTWPYKLLIDERLNVSYPDATEDDSGNIHMIYDYDRAGVKNILYCRFNEDNIKKSIFDVNTLKPIVIQEIHSK